MKVFLIVVAVIVILLAIILSLSAGITLIYDNGWKTTVRIVFWEKDVELSKILNFILFPDKAGKEAAKSGDKKKKEKSSIKKDSPKKEDNVKAENKEKADNNTSNNDANKDEVSPKKQNAITKILDEDGIVGVMTLASNLVETLNTAVTTLFKGLHIYSLYVKIIIGGGEADEIGRAYGTVCSFYYPLKGIILNGMKVDQYDDLVMPDYIAPSNEYGLQLIASMNVALILRIAIKAGFVFLVNFIKNK